MFGWWRKRVAVVKTPPRPTASEVDAEYAEYRSRIRSTMVFFGLVGGLGCAFLYLLAWISSVSSARELSGPGTPTTPQIVLEPLPAAMTVAGFGLLAAVAVALQLAVRTPSEAETRAATVLARRRFLCGIARIVVLGSFSLAAYAAIPALSSAPSALDIARIFGPLALGALVAFVAADAGVASDPDFAPAELGRVWRARVARRTLVGLRMIGDGASGMSRRAIAWQVVALIVTPVLAGLISSASAPEMTPRQRVILVVIALVVAGVIYGITVSIYVNAVSREWFAVAAFVLLAAASGLVLWLTLGIWMLQRSAEEESTALAPTLTVEAWALVYMAVPAALAAWSISPSRGGRPRALGLVVRAILLRRLARRHHGLNPSAVPPFNRLALTAPWLSVFLPFGMILGVIAKHQIRRASNSPTMAPQRGEWAANLAIVLTLAIFTLLIGALFVVAGVDAEEWQRFVWGTES